ncbi:MAG: DUF4870 domain-containing protein [Phycisphaerales bacterium JB039]
MGVAAAMPTADYVDTSLEPWERTWAMWAHLGTLIVAVLTSGLAQFVVPLVIWLSQRDKSAFVADHAREALNFQISVLIWGLIAVLLAMVTCGVGMLIVPAILVVMIICGILAAIAGSKGQYYRYPATFRLIK